MAGWATTRRAAEHLVMSSTRVLAAQARRSGGMSCASWAPRSPSRRNCVVRYMLIVAGSVGAKYPSTTRRSGCFVLLCLVRDRMVGIGVLFGRCISRVFGGQCGLGQDSTVARGPPPPPRNKQGRTKCW
jgi:hypothetical protein